MRDLSGREHSPGTLDRDSDGSPPMPCGAATGVAEPGLAWPRLLWPASGMALTAGLPGHQHRVGGPLLQVDALRLEAGHVTSLQGEWRMSGPGSGGWAAPPLMGPLLGCRMTWCTPAGAIPAAAATSAHQAGVGQVQLPGRIGADIHGVARDGRLRGTRDDAHCPGRMHQDGGGRRQQQHCSSPHHCGQCAADL